MPRPKSTKCKKCRKNEGKYRWKQYDRICKFCWDRYDNPLLAKKTDEEIQEMYDTNVGKVYGKRSIINASALNNTGR